MRVANIDGRATLLDGHGGGLDVAKASDGKFPSEPQALFEHWPAFTEWATTAPGADTEVDGMQLSAPTPAPRQVFAVGLNYDEHVRESAMGSPDSPTVFTKFPTSITGPTAVVPLPSRNVDWEVELVVAIGQRAYAVTESDALDHVAGLMVGQDISERLVQLSGPVPQFSLGKSYPAFAPIGPYLVTPDEVGALDDLELGCAVDGETLQHGNTRDMIFSIPELIARLSAICPLLPGDIIFTGTPSGVGQARDPKRFLLPGTTLTSYVQNVGQIENKLIPGATYPAAS